MARPTTQIKLSEGQKQVLEQLSNSREIPHSLVQRAQIILQSSQSINNKTICQNLGLNKDTVKLWRERWLEGGVELEKFEENPKKLYAMIKQILSDKMRAGSPVKFSAEQVCELIALACENPPEQLSHWTLRDLVREAIGRGIVENISRSSVGRFLKSGRFKASPDKILA